ncbi:hypothetical protein LH29_12825 [Draconibacterium sediminis]|uniref:Uncharacterized protein n=1 Tax=Draconibacterium sediminis TaxID=1544798 RepID=A0A0D8JDN4_9BACT|nr:hypothetical protein LH29_12825 [Draconibacterium sediminis]
MMLRVIFHFTFLERGTNKRFEKVSFSHRCIRRFLKAIVFIYKKGSTFLAINEDQHFLFRNVGLLFFSQPHYQIQYLRQ